MGNSEYSNLVIPSPPPGINFARNLLLREFKKQILRPQRPQNDNFLELL